VPDSDAPGFGDDVRELASDAWQLHHLALGSAPHLVTPSMPILYFGDSVRYRASPIRVVTVGLNPSREEFPTTDPWRRFPEGRTIDAAAPDLAAYLRSLDRYFDDGRHPYMRWFGMAFGAILRGLDADYHDQATNIAIHTDLCSPLATDPTWSGLSHGEQHAFRDGYQLWHRLVAALQPHVILMSVAERHLQRVTLPSSDEWTAIHTVPRKRPYEFRARRLDTPDRCLLVWGRATQLPFGSVANSDKQAAGVTIKTLVR
jgi:hypothetical protein